MTSLTNLFRGCINLQSVKCSTWNLSACTAIDQVFMGCGALEDVNISNWNVSNVQLFSYALQGCQSLRNINVASWNTSKATTINNMFESAQSLTDVITTNWNLSACTNASNLFNSCGNLRKVGPLNLSDVTNLGGSFATSCNSLANVAISGIKTSVNFSNCQMSATTLNTLYTNLSTVVGQTITVTGNYGTTSDDPTIAQNKGWTVTG
jgi:surface protein